MTDGVLPFSDVEYSKLQYSVFPTLRRRDKYGDVGDTNTITHGPKGDREELGTARIVAKETVCMEDERFTDAFFKFDTESESWDEAYDSINRFYTKLIEPDEELTLYWSCWTERYE